MIFFVKMQKLSGIFHLCKICLVFLRICVQKILEFPNIVRSSKLDFNCFSMVYPEPFIYSHNRNEIEEIN